MTFFVLSMWVSYILQAAFAPSTSRLVCLGRTLRGLCQITLISDKKAQVELFSCFVSKPWCRTRFCRAWKDCHRMRTQYKRHSARKLVVAKADVEHDWSGQLNQFNFDQECELQLLLRPVTVGLSR